MNSEDVPYVAMRVMALQHDAYDIVLVTGVFDCIHLGHIELLRYAYRFGFVLVGLNADNAVKQLKGSGRPIHSQTARLAVIDSIRFVSGAFLINETTVTNAILEIKPTVWVKGSDYTLKTLNQEERKAAESVGTRIVFAPKVEGYSSSNIIERMKG